MRIGILGAGISGLALGRLLHASFEVELLEQAGVAGGIARVTMIGDIPYHHVGGHCLNSSIPGVMDFIFENVLPKYTWREIQRVSAILFHKHYISYPIEQSIAEIAVFDEELALNMTADFFCATASGNDAAQTLDRWLRQTFGTKLAEEYFIPYNRKVWNTEPSKMSSTWVKGKLPIPDRKIFFHSLLGRKDKNVPHAAFFYPQKNTQNAFIDALASGLRIVYNYPVTSLEKKADRWIINGEKSFDLIVSTLPLDSMPSLLPMSSEEALQFKRLKSNGIKTVLYKTNPRADTWTYFPDKELAFHRIISIGNFLEPKMPYAIVESIGGHSFEKICHSAKNIDFLLEPIAEHQAEYAYPVFDKESENSKKEALRILNSKGIYSLGRFAEWEYYNMDVCIHRAMETAKAIMRINN